MYRLRLHVCAVITSISPPRERIAALKDGFHQWNPTL